MQVAKWGNSLAVRLPAVVVEALGLKEGDEIEIHVADRLSIRRGAQARPRRAVETPSHLPRPPPRRFQVRPGRGECPLVFSIPTSWSISHRVMLRKPIGRRRPLPGAARFSVQVLNEIANVARRKMQMSWTTRTHSSNMLRGLLTVHPLTVETHDTGLRLAELGHHSCAEGLTKFGQHYGA